jgi:hypothetical protein
MEYSTWQDLLDEEPEDGEREAHAQSDTESVSGTPTAASSANLGAELPPAIQSLLAEREKLEQEFKVLTGEADAGSDEKRQALMFPVPVHTKETRVAERREHRERELSVEQHHSALGRKKVVEKQEKRRRRLLDEALAGRTLKRRLEVVWQQRRSMAAKQCRKKERLDGALDEKRQRQWEEMRRHRLTALNKARRVEQEREEKRAERSLALALERCTARRTAQREEARVNKRSPKRALAF